VDVSATTLTGNSQGKVVLVFFPVIAPVFLNLALLLSKPGGRVPTIAMFWLGQRDDISVKSCKE